MPPRSYCVNDQKDFDLVKRDKGRFKFDWHKYKQQDCEVYKLYLKRTNVIMGLICLIEHPRETGEDAIEINLIELSAENRGTGKQYDNVAGCLIAFACEQSFEMDHDGYVFLKPKTGLLKHYQTKYGFCHFPVKTEDRPMGIMVLNRNASLKLIKKYLKDNH